MADCFKLKQRRCNSRNVHKIGIKWLINSLFVACRLFYRQTGRRRINGLLTIAAFCLVSKSIPICRALKIASNDLVYLFCASLFANWTSELVFNEKPLSRISIKRAKGDLYKSH